MIRKEKQEVQEQLLFVYSGILYHNQKFAPGNREVFTYDYSCPEYQILKDTYDLEAIAGKGADFQRAKRLMHAFSARLTHASNYDNHVECNAMKLLEYSLDNPEQGINCVSKAKILQEMCMAVGIPARRVWIMPYSPYDFDNHVVTEIYDRKQKKWIMLDMTTDAWFVDENRQPLSIPEIRDCFANDRFVTGVCFGDKTKDLQVLRRKNMELNAYICKNMFYFLIDQDSKFGDSATWLLFAPEHFSRKSRDVKNAAFRLRHLPEEYSSSRAYWEKHISNLEERPEKEVTDMAMMEMDPV